MKTKAAFFNSFVALFIAVTGMVIISSCGSSSVSGEDAYNAGNTIGRMIFGD